MSEDKNYEVSKPEFFGLMMIYAANIDGEEHENEIAAIKASLTPETYERCAALYAGMNDYELISFFRDNKSKFIKSEVDEKIFLSEIKTVVAADHHMDIMENALILAMKKILHE